MKKNRKSLKLLLFLISFVLFNCSSINVIDSQKRFLLNNKGNKKYFLINYINKNRIQIGEVPTLIINKKDGHELIRSDNEFSQKLNLKRSDFRRIEVLSIEKSILLYGSAGKNGVLIISYYGIPNL